MNVKAVLRIAYSNQNKKIRSNLVKIVEFNIWHILWNNQNFNPCIFHEKFDKSLRAERVIYQQTIFFISPEIIFCIVVGFIELSFNIHCSFKFK